MDIDNIRNFCIVAHIDHGKSTLADRFLELTKSVEKVGNTQLLDSMDLERERGITIKLKAVRMSYSHNGKLYDLNLVDTPGHVDFGYEVSRALRSVEGAILLVDATQGVQAQTIANMEKAKESGLFIIPVLNKIDLSSAQIESTILQLVELGFNEKEIMMVSAKTGEGVKELLKKVIESVPSPKEKDSLFLDEDKNTSKALVFDSYYDDYRGVVAYVRVFEGSFKRSDNIKFMATGVVSDIVDIGYMAPVEKLTGFLDTGEIGFIATGLKDISKVRVGDTLTLNGQNPKPIPGYMNLSPIRASLPIPLRTILTFAPIISHKLAISFIKLILVASMEFAAYLVISAEGISIKITGCPFKVKGLYKRFINSSALVDSIPTTIRSGLRKSSTAAPSFKNSGLEATSKGILAFLFFSSSDIAFFTLHAVPTGTVLLVTTSK